MRRMNMKHALILLSALGLLCQNLIAAEVPRKAHDPVDLLKTAHMFGIGPIGYAGTISVPEKALRQVMKQKDAKLVLTKILGEATLEGQMYALVGLKAVDDSEFKSRLKSYADKTNQVRTIKGCMMSHQDRESVAKAIAADHYK